MSQNKYTPGPCNEDELQLAILYTLYLARKKKPASSGLSGKMLMDTLQLENVSDLEKALQDLRQRELLRVEERVFSITAEGVDLCQSRGTDNPNLPDPDSGPSPGSGPRSGPGPFRPRNDPGDPALIRRKPKPGTGGSAEALNLPKPANDSQAS